MHATVTTFHVDQLVARRVEVEVNVTPGEGMTVLGSSDTVAAETHQRVCSALAAQGFAPVTGRVTVNVIPLRARWPVGSACLDLAVACGLLLASGQLPAGRLAGMAVFGGLHPDGTVHGIRGSLPAAEAAAEHALTLIVAPGALNDTWYAPHTDTVTFATDGPAALSALRGTLTPVRRGGEPTPVPYGNDLIDVRGNDQAVQALIIAAAGGHPLMLVGDPGTGRRMLADRLPGLLPDPTGDERLTIARIRSAVGSSQTGETARPLRCPHHSSTPRALVGDPEPGEVAQARGGVLALDAADHISRYALDALSGELACDDPMAPVLVLGCEDPTRVLTTWTGPSIDLLAVCERPDHTQTASASTAMARQMVAAARRAQAARGQLNATLTDDQAADLLDGLTIPADRDPGAVGRVARTIADLNGHRQICTDDLAQTLQLTVAQHLTAR